LASATRTRVFEQEAAHSISRIGSLSARKPWNSSQD
jgi:hypothetical protein